MKADNHLSLYIKVYPAICVKLVSSTRIKAIRDAQNQNGTPVHFLPCTGTGVPKMAKNTCSDGLLLLTTIPLPRNVLCSNCRCAHRTYLLR